MFENVLASVMSFFNISSFAKDENGKSKLLSEQKQKLTEKWGEKFVADFEKELATYEAKDKSADGEDTKKALENIKAESKKTAEALEQAQAKIKTLEAEKTSFESKIQALEKESVGDKGEKLDAGKDGMERTFKPDMNLSFNKYVSDYFSGKVSAAYSGDTTVDTSALQTEFGKYVNGEKMEIFLKLLNSCDSIQYMSTIVTDKTEVRASSAQMTSVLQQFVPYWTPKGKSTFTPLTIKNFKCKINVPIVPSDVMDQMLGYMYDENLRPEDMYIVKYIVEQLIFPKLDEEREQALATGKFVESTAVKDGDGASNALDVMDGYLTQLIEFRKNKVKIPVTWLLDGLALDDDDVKFVAQIDTAVDQVKAVYKKKKMSIHADPDLITRYGRGYRTKYPYTKNEDGEKVKVDFTNFTFVPLEGMRGSKSFFITPQENFKHLVSRDPQSRKMYAQAENYSVKIFAEWWEGVGFWIAEAIFAYLPPAPVGSGSAGGV